MYRTNYDEMSYKKKRCSNRAFQAVFASFGEREAAA